MRVLLPWLQGYAAPRLRLDVIAGLSLAAFAIPESLAYATLADLPPVSGLYCYLVAGLAYALLGNSRQLAVGPTSALALAVAAGIAATGGGDAGRAVALASGVALLVGLIAIGGRYLGLAQVAYFLSDTVVTGFKTGAAIYIASTQLPKLFGLEGIGGTFFERMAHVISLLPHTHMPTLAVAAGAVLLFLLLEWLLPGRPTTLIVVGGAIAAAHLFDPAALGIHLVGTLPAGLPEFGLPDLRPTDIGQLIPTALACFLLCYGESISVARTFAQKHGYEIDPERELTALGLANVATGLARGFPVAGGMSQTAINDMGGATSPLSLVITSIAVALTLLFIAPLFRVLPEPVLGAIVLMAAKHLVKLDELRRLREASRMEFRIALVALGGVLAFGLLNGLLLAALGSLIVLLVRASRPAVVVLARDPTGRFVNRDRLAAPDTPQGILIVRSAGAWVYFNADHIRRQVLDFAEHAVGPVRTVILDCSMMPSVDFNAANSLCDLARSLMTRGAKLQLAELRDDVVEKLKSRGVEACVGPLTAHLTIEACLEAAG